LVSFIIKVENHLTNNMATPIIPSKTNSSSSATINHKNGIKRYCIIGLGQRALGYVKYIYKRSLPYELLGVYDTNQMYQDTFLSKIKQFVRSSPKEYKSIEGMRNDRDIIDLVFICTPDNTHITILSEVVGWCAHIILEKPITITYDESKCMLNMVSSMITPNRFIHVPLVLRFTNHYKQLKQEVLDTSLGNMIQVHMTLSLTVSHTASYQRRWHRLRSNSGGFIVTKCCHDIDLLHWLISSLPKYVVSFSRNKTFTSKKKADGCSTCDPKVKESCVYEFDGRYVVKSDMEDIGVYDRCVYDDKNESIDGQQVLLQFKNGVLCSYNVCMFQPESTRAIELTFERATIRSCFKTNRIHITYNDGRGDRVIYPEYDAIGHHGGDIAFLNHVYSNIADKGSESHTLFEESIDAMKTCSAIMTSSDTNKVVHL